MNVEISAHQQEPANPTIQSARRLLGRFRRWLTAYSGDYWYMKRLSDLNDLSAHIGPSDIMWHIKTNDRCGLVAWLQHESEKFPWIYDQHENLSADSNDHLYIYITEMKNIIGYIKVAYNNVYIRDYEGNIPLEADTAFIYDTFILPKYRRKGLASTLLHYSLMHLRERGIDYVYCHIPAWNKDSATLYQRQGFTRTKKIRYLRLMSFRFFFLNPVNLMNITKMGIPRKRVVGGGCAEWREEAVGG